ncbi:MAG: type II toxin-antitoxin system prevent-host-death family antitoxin [Acidobacteriota bacterium]
MVVVNSYEAKTQLSRLIRRALEGERIVIAKAGKPLVELRPYRDAPARVGGAWKGQVEMADDFDAPLTDLEDLIYGDAPSS